jgi:hypothetical protein
LGGEEIGGKSGGDTAAQKATAGMDKEGPTPGESGTASGCRPASVCEGLVRIIGPADGDGGADWGEGIGGLGRGKRSGEMGAAAGGLPGRIGCVASGRWPGDSLARARGSNDSSLPSTTGPKPLICSSMNLKASGG